MSDFFSVALLEKPRTIALHQMQHEKHLTTLYHIILFTSKKHEKPQKLTLQFGMTPLHSKHTVPWRITSVVAPPVILAYISNY